MPSKRDHSPVSTPDPGQDFKDAPPSDIEAALRSKIRDYLELLKKLNRKPSSEEIHDYRVASRRLLAVEPLLRAHYKTDAWRLRIRQSLKKLNRLRDLHVMRHRMGGLASLNAELEEDIRHEQKIKKNLHIPSIEKKIQKSLAVFCKSLETHHASVLENFTTQREKILHRVHRNLDEADATNPKSLHKLRVKFKAFRYFIEFLEDARLIELKAESAGFKYWQDLLGEIQDREIALEWLERIPDSAAAWSQAHSEKKRLISRFDSEKANFRRFIASIESRTNGYAEAEGETTVKSGTHSVYVLYTGGTIGMAGTPLRPMAAADFTALLATQPGFTGKTATLPSPAGGETVVEYVLDALETPLDSSCMVPQNWVTIAERILDQYPYFDGFVVLHGTDTMAWTAAALSYLLEGLSKPVVITGSQIPLGHEGSDGPGNLTASLSLAAVSNIPEVCLFFDTELMRGNRAVKIDACGAQGFSSPNLPALATFDRDGGIRRESGLPPPPEAVSLAAAENRRLLKAKLGHMKSSMGEFSAVVLNLFPGIPAAMVDAIFQIPRPPVKGMVLQAFGAGNAPSTASFLEALSRAGRAGVCIVDVSQCRKGRVDLDAYESAAGLKKAGVISGFDLTAEAALCKLIYLIAQGIKPEEVKLRMQTPIRGDLTLPT
ncbi:MAG: asparaginase domain-containing protein [Gammaproteobacteria bacterium]